MNLNPLVSCLCVTRNRVNLLDRAIGCFLSQTYKNKELIIVVEEDDPSTLDYVKTLNEKSVRLVTNSVYPKKTLGELRNIAIKAAGGDYICQWDDDDWSHCDRIKRQLTASIENYHPGSILTNWFIYDVCGRQAYLSYFRWWEGSVLFDKRVLKKYGIRYPSLGKGEDSAFLQEIINTSKIFPLVAPSTYIYCHHGGNTWGHNHFRGTFQRSQKLSPVVSELIGNILDGKYPNHKASELLNESSVLKELNFLHEFRDVQEVEKISEV